MITEKGKYKIVRIKSDFHVLNKDYKVVKVFKKFITAIRFAEKQIYGDTK